MKPFEADMYKFIGIYGIHYPDCTCMCILFFPSKTLSIVARNILLLLLLSAKCMLRLNFITFIVPPTKIEIFHCFLVYCDVNIILSTLLKKRQ